jgi:acetyl esterase/lipase
MKTETIYLYPERTDASLKTYIQDDSGEILAGGKRPLILVCPGGAYLGCSDREAEPVALRFAAMGYHAAVLRYSTYFAGGPWVFPAPGEDFPPIRKESVHPIPVREIATALHLLAEKADEWLIDRERMAICGFSAGAHNCAMYATNWHKPYIRDFIGGQGAVKPVAAILGYGLSDYVRMKQSAQDPEAKAFFAFANNAFLGKSDVDDALLTEVSPARNVTENTPPMFIWTTAADSLVPPEQSLLMALALAEHQIPYELHVFEEGPHGLSLATQATSVAGLVDANAAKWAGLCEVWLEKRLALKGKE